MTALFWEYYEIYARYGEPITNWRRVIDKVTIASVNNAFQNIEAFDLFRKREEVITSVEKEVRENFKRLGFTLQKLMILNIDIPQKFNAAVKKTQIVKQNQEKFNYTIAIEEIKGTTRVKAEILDREILTSKALAESTATRILSEAEASTTIQALAIERDMCRNVKNNMGKNSNDFLMDFIWIRLLEKKIVDGVDTTISMELPEFSP